MTKSNVLEWDTAAASNTEINNIGVQGSNAVNNFDNAFRELMAQGATNLVSRFTSRAVGYTAVKADHNQISIFTASATLSLTAAATLTNGWQYVVVASGGDVTIDPNGSELINGLATITVLNGQRATIWCNGTAFYAAVYGEATIGASIQGQIYGLTLSNNGSDATNDIDIAAGSAASDGATPYLMTLASALTKRLDAAWAVGTGNGGLDAGSIANTTYHMWLIQRSDTGVVDALFSASATAPTMPTSYDRKRRIGAIIRAAAAILPFIQHEDTFWHNNATNGGVLDINVANPGTGAATRTLASLPTGIQVDAIVNLGISNTTGSSSVTTATALELVAASPGSTFASGLWNVTVGSGPAIGVQGMIRTNTSAQIRTQTSVSGASLTLQIGTLGWRDSRGRLA